MTLYCLQTVGSAWHSPAGAAGQRTPWGTAPGSQAPVQQRVTGSCRGKTGERLSLV